MAESEAIERAMSTLSGELTRGVARHGPSRARPDLLVTYHAYVIPFHEVLYNWSIELKPCSLRRITVLGSPPNLTKQGLLTVQSTKVTREPILVAEKWRRKFCSAASNPRAQATSVSWLRHWISICMWHYFHLPIGVCRIRNICSISSSQVVRGSFPPKH